MVRRRLIGMTREDPALKKHRNQCQAFNVGFLYKYLAFDDMLGYVGDKIKFLVMIIIKSLVIACVDCT